MRPLLLVLLLPLASTLMADANKIDLDLSTLATLPERRHATLVLNAFTGGDNTPEISNKRRAYYAALKVMAEEIRRQYYFHDQFPADVFVGIEDRADVLVATNYAASPTTGCSYVDMLRENYMNQMAEEVIVSMASAIFVRATEKDIRVIGSSPITEFREWNEKWVAAGAVDGGPNPEQEPRITPGAALSRPSGTTGVRTSPVEQAIPASPTANHQ